MKIFNTLLFIFLSTGSFLFGQSTLSAKDAVFKALANNYNVQIAHLQVDIAEKNNTWGEAGLFPTVTLGAGMNNVIQDNTNNPFTFTPGIILQQSLSPSLSANWNLFSGFAVKISKERLALMEEQSKGSALALIESTTQDVLKAYYTAQLQKQRMDLFKDLMVQSNERLKYYTLKEKYSASNSLELLQFRNQYLTDSSNFMLQEMSFHNAVRNLHLLMNDTTEHIDFDQLILTDSLNFSFPLIDRESAKSEMLSNNQNLKNQYISVSLQEKQTELQRSFLYPTLSFQAGVTPNYAWLRDLKNPDFKINTQTLQYYGNFRLNYTLFNNWKTMRAVQTSKIQEEISLLTKDNLEATLVSNLERLLENYEFQSGLLAIANENLDYATQAWSLAQRRFDSGLISSLDLATFRTTYENLLIQYYESQYAKLESYLEIYKMTGNLSLDFVEEN